MHGRDLRLLSYFLQITRSGSIRATAEAMSVSPPVVSKALRDLEDLLGVTLIRRTTRRQDLTEAGRELLRHAEAMAEHAAAAMNVGAADRAVSGTLRLSAPVELAESWLPPFLQEYHERYPDVVLGVEAEDAAVDLGHTDVDLVVRATPLPSTAAAADLHPAPIAQLALDLVVAPGLDPKDGELPERLMKAGILLAQDRPGAETRWTAPDGTEGVCVPPIRAVGNDRRTLRALALRGMGALLLIRDTAVMDILEGRLERMAPENDYGIVAIRLIPVDPQPAPPVRAFLGLMDELNRR